ncbi:MAG: DsbA family protein [Nitrospirota bacterium]
MTSPITVYSDFNCPFCYALNERLRSLSVEGQVSWRGVQHAPGLPVPLRPCRGDQAGELKREVDAVHRLAADLPITVPPGKPNTARAIQAAAFAMSADPSRGREFKDLLYRALWCEGADLSDPSVLDLVAWQAGFAGLSFAGLDRHLTAATVGRWQNDWERTGRLAVPLLLHQNGQSLVGLPTAESLASFLRSD